VPELPEVETVARDLAPRLVGATITGIRVDWLRTLRSEDPDAFASAVVGHRVEAVWRRAKLVVLELDGGLAITIHLKMTGQLFVVDTSLPVDPYVRLVLELDRDDELRFRDIRKFGRVGVARRDEVSGELEGELGGPRGFKGFGPEPLSAAFTLPVFRERLRARRGRLKPLLLDQAFVAGIGNIYADEALWRARLHPLRSASTLRPPDERRLYVAIREVLGEAVERRGSSIDDYTAPDGDGSMQERLDVYQRAGEPCHRCGRPIRRFVLGGRATHACSWCQRLPAADRASATAILATADDGPRRAGPRWSKLRSGTAGGADAAGLTAAERAAIGRRERTERTKAAAATRRAAARAGTIAPDAG
jgi:formamidopyrimidine-DNA glycosylase